MRILLCLVVAGCSANGLPNGSTTTGGTATTTGGTTGGNPDTSCGGKAGRQCASDEWCDYPDSATCGNFDVEGTCRKRPTGCDKNLAPVCGCDFITYSNVCLAQMAGVDISANQACEGPPIATCGGMTGGVCGMSQFCDYPAGQMCDWADGTGTCKDRPQACNDLYDPVCGCDGMTYGNDCQANQAGWGVAYKGQCMSTGDCRTSGCPQGQKCQLCWTTYSCLDPNVAC